MWDETLWKSLTEKLHITMHLRKLPSGDKTLIHVHTDPFKTIMRMMFILFYTHRMAETDFSIMGQYSQQTLHLLVTSIFTLNPLDSTLLFLNSQHCVIKVSVIRKSCSYNNFQAYRVIKSLDKRFHNNHKMLENQHQSFYVNPNNSKFCTFQMFYSNSSS